VYSHAIHLRGELVHVLLVELLLAPGFGLDKLLYTESDEGRALIVVIGVVCDVEVNDRSIDDEQFIVSCDELPSLR